MSHPLQAELDRLRAENALLRGERENSQRKLSELSHILDRQQQIASSLAEANANAAELMAQLEESLEEQRALSDALADANTLAAELMRARDAEQQRAAELLEIQQALRQELAAAAAYVRSLLPRPLTGAIQADWRFLPSAELGGDAFGYHWIDDEHFAIYLLDVCGHGLAATLLATAALSALRTQHLGGADHRSPGQVLSALNEAFPMALHNNTYFTLWYGVYCRTTRELRYASGGHPPALLLPHGHPSAVELSTPNPMIGIADGIRFEEASHALRPGDSLLIFSDGAYELTLADGSLLTFEAFSAAAAAAPRAALLDQCVAFARRMSRSGALSDDLSLLAVGFNDA